MTDNRIRYPDDLTFTEGGYEFRQTCSSCPEQYDVYLDDKYAAYVRLRHGELTVTVPASSGEHQLVFSDRPYGADGMFEDAAQRAEYLQLIAAALAKN